MDQAPLLGRCKECDFALFATRDNVTNVDDFKGIRESGRAYRVGNNGHFARCDKRHKVFVLKTVKGTYSPDHKCDSRCLNAKGNNCTCSCGGANHGAGHVVTTHVAVSKHFPPSPAGVEPTSQTSQHIGEVGKHIKGTATCIAVKTLDESTLYTFATSSGSIIKWFAPNYVSIVYAPGQKVTFRAKVKAHQEFRGEAQTVVTYLEEV